MLPPPPPKRHGSSPFFSAPSSMPKTLPPPRGKRLTDPPARRGSGESHVRLRAMPLGDVTWLDANLFLDEIGEEHLNMAVSLAALERAIAHTPWDPSARAALTVLGARVGELGRVGEALTRLHDAATDARVHRALVPDGPLADYLRGIYAWVHASLRALEQLAADLRALTPDWAQLRYRLEEAKLFHFAELEGAVHAELVALALTSPEASRPLERAVDRLFDAARDLAKGLDQRFG